MTIAHIPTSHEEIFVILDGDGNTQRTERVPVAMPAITPLAAMEMFETLHANRNRLRREIGQREIPTPDAALLVLVFLRRVEEVVSGERLVTSGDGDGPLLTTSHQPLTTNLATLLQTFRETVQSIQEARLESATGAAE